MATRCMVMERTTKPFTRPQALRQGLTDAELGGPTVQRIFQGVYVRADKAVPYGSVVRVLAAMRAKGVTDMGLVAEPEDAR